MKIAIFGTDMVGSTLGTKLVQIGHKIMMGSRTASSDAGREWLHSVGGKAQIGTFADAALRQAGSANLRGKVLIQISNPLDFSKGMPASLTVCNTDSLGEQIQREFPDTPVVKALNTVNCEVMVEPSLVPGDHDLIISGNDASAKRDATKLLGEWFGWKKENIIDLGDITAARGTEMYLALWLRLWGVLGTPHLNIKVLRGS